MEELWIFLGLLQNWTIWRGSYLDIQWLFLKVQNRYIFWWVAVISNILGYA